MAVRNPELAGALARAVSAFDSRLILFAPAVSEMARAAREAGLTVAREGFPDRAYQPDGGLVSRSAPGAVVHDVDLVVARAVQMVRDHAIMAVDGSRCSLEVDTICIHGDTPGADRLATAVRAGLEAAGVTIAPFSQ
jgi:UPF0271 protein